MIPDSLFSPPQSPCSHSSKSLFPSPQSPCFVLFRVPLPILQFLFLPLKVLSHPPRFPCPSSSIISKSYPLLPDSRSLPLPSSSSEPKKTAERHEAVPPFLVVRSKMEHCLFLSVYEGLQNNPLNNVENSYHSTT